MSEARHQHSDRQQSKMLNTRTEERVLALAGLISTCCPCACTSSCCIGEITLRLPGMAALNVTSPLGLTSWFVAESAYGGRLVSLLLAH